MLSTIAFIKAKKELFLVILAGLVSISIEPNKPKTFFKFIYFIITHILYIIFVFFVFAKPLITYTESILQHPLHEDYRILISCTFTLLSFQLIMIWRETAIEIAVIVKNKILTLFRRKLDGS